MGRQYEQFSVEEREEIARLQAQGASIRQIAAALDRSPSSVSRELKRNVGAGPRADPTVPRMLRPRRPPAAGRAVVWSVIRRCVSEC